MSMIVNRRDLDFLLFEMLGLEDQLKHERFADYDRETVTTLLDAAQTIAEEKFLPCAARLDANEPEFDGERVHIIEEVSHAIEAFRDAGLFAAGFDSRLGGLQLPWTVNQAIAAMFTTANVGISDYLFLTSANANLLNICGSDALKAKYLQPLVDGRWFGTMCLSEPQAGSSLGDIRTRATPTRDGHYRIDGTKMWISGGEHELSENIIHMVLAKIPGGPPGVRGISLFLVPRRRVNDDGSLGQSNNIALAGLNHKMGHRGCVNALLNFGESGECHGWLVGQEHQGLANMFHMMNEARIAVGLGAASSALAGFLASLDYARNRPQGRPLGDKNPESPPVMLIEHPDVRRLLMTQKVYVEGAHALLYYCAQLIDRRHTGEGNAEHITLLLELLTPICKSWPSEYGLEANKLAIQVLGGYGYTRDFPVERFYRDNRLNHIHEGAHAIHGLDILGRKVRMHDGAALKLLHAAVVDTLKAADAHPTLDEYCATLRAALGVVDATTREVLACADPTRGLANATLYLDAMGHVVVGWMWLWQAVTALEAQGDAPTADADFYAGKLAACRFFFRYEMPRAVLALRTVGTLDDTCLDAQASYFTGQ